MSQPKANFKHSLPQHYSAEYFTDIRKRLAESVAEQMQRAKAQKQCVGCYDGEEVSVGLDLVEACRMLESAPLDYWEQRWMMSGRRSNSSRRPDSATSRSSSQHLQPILPSSRPPRAATPTTPKSPLVSLAEGRTADGLYGLNHHPPHKDQFNGPCQAFLENDAESYGKVGVWQSWGEARNQFFEEGANVASQVFTFACADETIVAVSPSTPPSGAGGGPTGRHTPSTPFRRSPRPDYEARLSELQSNYVKIGASSWLHFEKALMVHIWRCETSARRFAHGWQRCWQSIFEHRIRGIHCPLSVMYHIQGITLSVTALPPVYIDKVPPLTNIFAPFVSSDFDLHRRTSKVPKLKDGKGVRSQALGHMVARLFAVLHIQQDDTILDEFGDCNLYAGVDGRWYMLQLGPVLSHSTSLLSRIGGTGGVPVRHELLRQVVLDSHPTSGGLPHNFHVTDLTNKGLHRYVLQVAIPKAMSNAVALLPMGTASSRKSEALVRDAFLPMMLHDHGVNMGYLYYVYQHCLKQATSLTPLDQDAGEEGLVAGVSHREAQELKRGTARRPRPTAEDAEHENSSPASPAALYMLLAKTCVMEMMTRTIKHLVRLDCVGGFCTAWKTSTTVRLDMVNRVARLSASRDTDFLVAHVIPALRMKFRCAEDFIVGWDSVPIGTLLKVLSLKLGVEYGVSEGRFNVFAPFAKKRGVLMVPLVAIDALLAQDQPRMHDGVGQLWADANRVVGRQPTEHAMVVASQAPPVLSTMHGAFLARALVFSIATRMHRSLVWTYKPLDSAFAKKNTAWPMVLIADIVEHVAAAQVSQFSEGDAEMNDTVLAFDSRGTEIRPNVGPRFDDYRNLLKDFLQEETSTGAHPPVGREDTSMWALRMLDCSNIQMRAGRPEAATSLRLAMDSLFSVPHIDFVFSAIPSQSLKRLESVYSTLDPPNVAQALSGITESVIASLRRWNRLPNAARYATRVVTAMLNYPVMEQSPHAPRIAHLCVQLSTTVYGPHDARTSYAVYVMALFGLCHAGAQKSLASTTLRAVDAQIANLRKIIRKHTSLLPPMQLAFNKTQAVHSVLQKLVLLLSECGDDLAVPTLQSAVFHSDRYRQAVGLLQSVGRGFTRRSLLASSKGPFALPKRQSSLTYYEGEVPISLGQTGNLGISLEDESTREWRGRPKPVQQQQQVDSSDVNSVTGSFTSSTYSSSSRPPRFAPQKLQNTEPTIPKPVPRPAPGSEPSMSLEPTYTLRRKQRPPALPEGTVPPSLVQTVEAHQQQAERRMPGQELSSFAPSPNVTTTTSTNVETSHFTGFGSQQSPEWSALATKPQTSRRAVVNNAWDFSAPYSPTIPPGACSDEEDAPALPLGNTLAVSAREPSTSSVPQSSVDLFRMCDSDEDGVATVRECVDVVSRLHIVSRDELMQAFSAVATKQKRRGLTSLFSKAKEVVSLKDFHSVLGKLGLQ